MFVYFLLVVCFLKIYFDYYRIIKINKYISNYCFFFVYNKFNNKVW